VTLAVALAGLALGTAAVIWLGAGHVFHAILAIGWRGILEVVTWQLAVFVLLGLAWRILLPGVPVWLAIWGRLVREGGETCLPLSEIGGLVFGARALMLGGVDLARAGAASIVDAVAEGMGLAPFLLFGLTMLLARKPGSSLALPMALGLVMLLLCGGGLFLVRRQLADLLRRGIQKMLQAWVKDAPDKADAFAHKLTELFGQRRRVAAGALLHVLCWVGGGGNVWIAYHLLGARPSVLDAVAIEAILSGVMAIGFLVPSGLGVQELTYVGVGKLFGMPAHISLALSLVRRARDILIGAPALLAWQALEAKHLRSGTNE
jgi:putative membrane protein